MPRLSKCTATALAAALCMAAPAFAASDGTKGESSSGDTDVTVNVDVAEDVQITGLSDFVFDITEANSDSTFSATDDICIYTSSGTEVNISATGLNDVHAEGGQSSFNYYQALSFADTGGSQTLYVDYQVQVDPIGDTQNAVLNSGSYRLRDLNISDESCSGSGGVNAELKITVANSVGGMNDVNDAISASSTRRFSLTDTLTIVVEPVL